MTVLELIEILNRMPQDAPVCFCHSVQQGFRRSYTATEVGKVGLSTPGDKVLLEDDEKVFYARDPRSFP